MLRGKALPKNGFVLVEDGHSYLFDSAGLCVQDDAGNLAGYLNGALCFSVISILSSAGVVRVGVWQGSTMKDYGTALDASACALVLMDAKGFIRMLRREGENQGLRFNQLLFVYNDGVDLSDRLNELRLKED